MDDPQILQLFYVRDPCAIVQTQNRYGEKLFHLALNILHNREDAEEAVNDTYWKAWDTIPPQNPQFFFAYLAQICRRLAFGKLDWLHAKKRSGQLVNLSRELQVCVPAGEPDRQVESKELVQALTRFLASLPPEARILFVRRYWFADSISDIASQCQISTAKVKTSLHRIRKKLKHFLEQEGFSL